MSEMPEEFREMSLRDRGLIYEEIKRILNRHKTSVRPVLNNPAKFDKVAPELEKARNEAEKAWNDAKAVYSSLYNARISDLRLTVAEHNVANAYHVLQTACKAYNSVAYPKG
jgi:hypothetical protein